MQSHLLDHFLAWTDGLEEEEALGSDGSSTMSLDVNGEVGAKDFHL